MKIDSFQFEKYIGSAFDGEFLYNKNKVKQSSN